ncbi:MAG: hypothetical protein WCC64_09915 [Aliidongia sp.]
MVARTKGLARNLTANASYRDSHLSNLQVRVGEIEDAALAELIADREQRRREKAAWREELARRRAGRP